MFNTLRRDIQSVFDRDPAARSLPEVLLCYPGLYAVWGYRLSHWLWTHHLKLLGRYVSQIMRFFTGIEIHPGRQDRARAVHRSRHGRGDWRNGGARRRGDAVSHGDAGRHEPAEGQAPSHAGRSGDGRRGREDPRPDRDRLRQPHRRECGRGEIGAAQLGHRRRAGADHRAQQAAHGQRQARPRTHVSCPIWWA